MNVDKKAPIRLTDADRAVIALACIQAGQVSGRHVSEVKATSLFKFLKREGAFFELPAPEESKVRAWLDSQVFIMHALKYRYKGSAAQLRMVATQVESGVTGPEFHAWRFLADYSAYTVSRKRRRSYIVAFDCDGVLYSFNSSLREWLAARGWAREAMPDPSVYSLKDAWGISNSTLLREMPLAVNAGLLWHEGEALVDGTTAARLVGSLGYTVMVNSARALPGLELQAEAATVTWLRSNGVHPDEVHIADPMDPQDKLRAEFHVLFDDHCDNVRQSIAAGRDAFVVDRPWNGNDCELPRMRFDEILDIVRGLERQYSKGDYRTAN